MKSIALKELNFQELLDIPQHFPPINLPAKHRFYPPRACGTFCISCEESGFCTTRYPYRMSHGADTEDIVHAVGIPFPRHPTGQITNDPVMFLGIEPGGDYGNDKLLPHPTYPKYQKMVPIYHYYWTAKSGKLPLRPEEVTEVPGPVFAYLIYRFGFKNAYFSNIVKCRLWDENRKKHGLPSPGEVDIKPDKLHLLVDHKVRQNCIQKYLLRELSIHHPKVIFVLGDRGMNLLVDESDIDNELLVPLVHYGYVNRNQISIEKYVSDCEQTIAIELKRRKVH